VDGVQTQGRGLGVNIKTQDKYNAVGLVIFLIPMLFLGLTFIWWIVLTLVMLVWVYFCIWATAKVMDKVDGWR